MKSHSYKILIIFLLLFIYIFITSHSYANSIFQHLSSQIFRLHIIANSDSQEDQELKLKIRDNIIQYLKPKTIRCNNKDEVISIIQSELKNLQKISVQTIKENGYDYNVTLEIGNFYFPTKYYGNISMPSGNYDALRINIGNAKREKLVVQLISCIMLHRYI